MPAATARLLPWSSYGIAAVTIRFPNFQFYTFGKHSSRQCGEGEREGGSDPMLSIPIPISLSASESACMPGQDFWEILIKIEFSLHLIKSLVGAAAAAAAHEKWRNGEASNTKNYARDGSRMRGRGDQETHSSRRACTRCARDMRIITVSPRSAPSLRLPAASSKLLAAP